MDLFENDGDLVARKSYAKAVHPLGMAGLAASETRAPRGEQFIIDAYQASQVWARHWFAWRTTR